MVGMMVRQMFEDCLKRERQSWCVVSLKTNCYLKLLFVFSQCNVAEVPSLRPALMVNDKYLSKLV